MQCAVLPVRLIGDAEFKRVAVVGDAKDGAADGLWLVPAGMVLFQTEEDRLRFRGIKLQDNPALSGDACLRDELAIERRELAIGRIHEKPLFLGGGANANIGLLVA